MRRALLAIIALILILHPVAAISYADKPYFSAYIAQSNYITAGEEKTLYVVLQNSARLWKIDYADQQEFQLFSNNPDYLQMLSTAYNVSVRFESDGLNVKTPEMFFPAIPAFQPLQIPVVVDASGVEEGEYDLTLTIGYEVVDDVSFSSSLSITPVPSQDIYNYSYNATLGIYKPVPYQQIQDYQTTYSLDYLKIYYAEKNQEIRLKVVVEKPDVILNVTDVRSDIVAGGKGTITLVIKNDGKRDAENLFVSLLTPSGFTAQGVQQVDLESYTKALESMLSQNPMFSQFGLQGVEVQLPPELQSMLTQSAVYVGSLKAGESINVTFRVTANTEDGGYYPFQVRGTYTLDGDVKQTPPVAFGVSVKDKPEIRIVSVNSTVFAGSKGDVIIDVESTETLKDLKAKLETKPPLSAITEEYFVGDSAKATLKFRVKASGDAESTVYPAKLTLTYDLNGKEVEEAFDIGIKVGDKIKFALEGQGEIPAGEEKIITVRIKNTGSFEVKDATARITVVDPFSTTDDSSYIGSLKPGEAKEVSFRLKADKDATPKTYALNLEIKYRDLNDEWVISDPVKLPIVVTESRNTIPGFEALVAVIALIAVAVWMRK
ncbi:PGF-CTERM sorting domain-containing protein [Geoglobus acetivorans]|uniref:PGF-CTERM sorting domain-containing protein n=1 Tax=Geoglobus acetivorans TaxID=565033 RepID=A0ABZ3H4V6_GEOAI|nr:hypothetical protein [Geoglobus acetivorans]